MAPQVETDRDPQELAADLAALATIDWSAVWAGPPGDYSTIPAWCEQFGWTLDEIGPANDLAVSISTGRDLNLNPRNPYTAATAFSRADISCVQAKAETTEENPILFGLADQWWPQYLDAVQAVIGAAEVLTTWDDPAFPDLSFMPGASERATFRQPYQLAIWRLKDAIVVLAAFPSDSSTRPGRRGTMTLYVTVRPDDARQ